MVLWRKRPPLHVSVWDGVACSLWSCGPVEKQPCILKKIILREVVLWSCGGREPLLKTSPCIHVSVWECVFAVEKTRHNGPLVSC